MKRQQLLFNKKYLKYEFIQEINKLWNIFADNEVESNAFNITLLLPSKEIVNSMEEGTNKKFNLNFQNLPIKIQTSNSLKTVLCCISGGKDSLGTVLHYKQLGYDIKLYTVRGINKGYPEEYKSAIEIAEKLNLPLYIDEIQITGKKFYIEHPLKNQIIASMALAYCLENNIPPQISFGDYSNDFKMEGSNYGVNWTDNYNLWIHFNNYIKYFISTAEVYIPLKQESQTLKLLEQNIDIIPTYQSCLMPIRYREKLRLHNQEKFHIQILPKRCGSCRKCCYEYIYFCDHNIFEYNENYYKHCLEILKKKWFEYTGENRKFKNLKEVYQAYFGNSKSKYFNN